MTNVETKTRNLPIFKHFNENEIVANVESFRTGEKSLFWFFKLAVFGGLGYLTWVYVLPPVMQAIGELFAIAASGVFILFVILMIPNIVRGIREFTRFVHKGLIKYDPFAELYRQKQLMLDNQQTFRMAKGTIQNLKTDMEIDADKNEKEAKTMQTKILSLDQKSKNIKTQMDEMIKTNGVSAKGDDEYVNLNSELLKTLSDSQRISYQLTQAKDFVQKYGARAAIMKKFGQKLTMVETSMDIKILDFDATIDILKKDYEFAQKSRSATEAAKNAMQFGETWELDYALDVVTTTIASDIAITSGNLKDIDSLTKNYAIDSDELYANLDTLANNIRVGSDVVPIAKQYNNPEYVLTQSDRLISGGLENIF